ncbi:MAG: SET domain-containing protein-lysine N-methyltransferase [Bryobacterales bacterium]|nr:SET domain-containing protein-lysine N-methyltransferase [Bryobacterales bacterium]
MAQTRDTTWTVVSYHVGRFHPQTPGLDPRHVCFRLRVAPSPIHRYGVFAVEPIPRGRKVIEYTGERISRAETKKRYARPMHYLFTLDDYWTVDGSVGGSGAEYINHSCDPNLRAWIHKGHILYMSRRVIEPGEELTVDYKFNRSPLRDICSCGSPMCRGSINVL